VKKRKDAFTSKGIESPTVYTTAGARKGKEKQETAPQAELTKEKKSLRLIIRTNP